jgi:hypothetical protein
MKALHNFTVKTGDKETEITLKALGRRDREDLAVIYNAEYGKAVQRGLAPYAALRKSAIDAGGLWSESEVNRADEITRQIVRINNEIQLAVADNADVNLADKRDVLTSLLEEFQAYKHPETVLYSRSAEYEAEKNATTWAVLHYSLTKDEKGEWVYIFPGTTTESRLTFYYECAEAEKQFELEVFRKGYLCFYHHIKNQEETTPEVLKALTDENPES